MADVQVTCVTKAYHHPEGITGVGGLGWWKTEAEVIALIDARTNTYYTLAGGKRSEVLVVNGKTKRYLRTHADGIANDNLLNLPACPGR